MMEAETNKFGEEVIALAATSGLDAVDMFTAMSSLMASFICTLVDSREGRDALAEIAADAIRDAVKEIS